MVKIRLSRRGKQHYPTYRIVVAESKSPRDGKHVDDLGYYNPMKKPMDISIDFDKLDKWLATGAQPTERVAQLIKYARKPEALKALDKKRDEFRKARVHKKKQPETESEPEVVNTSAEAEQSNS